jgi:hypothetical protein
LDLVNQRCTLLESELKLQSGEVDSLRVFKVMARQADIREDTLRLMVNAYPLYMGLFIYLFIYL